MAASRNPRLRLLHIRDEIDGLATVVKDCDLEGFRHNYVIRRASERALQIVSEAAKALPAELMAQYPDAPWGAIIGLGNMLRHEYQHIDDRRLWEIVTVHLPRLRPVVARMLKDCES